MDRRWPADWKTALRQLGKLQLRGRGFGVPAAGGFAVDRADVFDRNLAASGLGAFDFDLRGVAGLLRNFLIRGGLVLDVKLGGGVRLEEEDPRFERDAMVDLFHDGPAKFEALQVRGFPIRISAGKDAVALG